MQKCINDLLAAVSQAKPISLQNSSQGNAKRDKSLHNASICARKLNEP